jgi:hypothetical protein
MRVFFYLFLLIFPSLAPAAPIRVQTGEHPGFTRMVFRIAPGSEWALGRIETGYGLRIAADDGYDLHGFFDLIPKTRIAEIVQNRAGEFDFVVPCDCRAEGFLVGEDVLVIDVSDGPPLSSSRFEERIVNATTPSPYVIGNQPILPLIATLPTVSLASSLSDLPEGSILEPLEPNASSFDEDLIALEGSISQSLASGLSQGVLALGRPEGEANGFDNTLRQQLRETRVGVPGINARTNLDTNAIPDDTQFPEAQSGSQCLPSAFFDVGEWADERPFSVQIAGARKGIISEVDRIDEDAVLRLARIFVFFGFGQEAIRTLDLDGVRSQERTYLIQIAHIIDADGKKTDLFEQEVSCQSPSALWAVLAAQDGPMDAQVNRAAVLGAFKALPEHLQRHLGPRLSARFVAIGDHDAALQVLDAGRDTTSKTLDASLAEATLDQAMGEAHSASETIAAAVRENSRVTPEVMITFMREAIENNTKIGPENFVLADALRFENAHLPVAGDLLDVQVRGYLMQQNFAQAAQLISQGETALGSARHQLLQDALARQATADMHDADFLSFAFETSPEIFSSQERSMIAYRLVVLGFEGRADLFALIDPQAANPANLVQPPDDHDENPDQAQPSVLELVTPSDPPLRATLRAMLVDETEIAPQHPTLAHGRQLLSQSQLTRETLETILQRFPPPDDQ